MVTQKYFSGKSLYGDSFSLEELEKWYKEEAEGYAELGNKNTSLYEYGYHEINRIHGFSKLQHISKFDNVLGVGSAYGHEFFPIIDKIRNITIIEPSDYLRSCYIGSIRPRYIKPDVKGRIPYRNESFDLITCFGTLHHIPNVSFVLLEMIRVLKPGGFMLLREPIVSLGDWRQPRSRLTKNERGIPINIFDEILSNTPMVTLHKNYCFAMTSFIQKAVGAFLKKPIYAFKPYVIVDKLISRALSFNIRYHRKSFVEKCSPTNVFYVLQKIV